MKFKNRLYLSFGLLVVAILIVTGLLLYSSDKARYHQKRVSYCHAQLDSLYEIQSAVLRYLKEINDAVLLGDTEFVDRERAIYEKLSAFDLISGREQEFLAEGERDLDDVDERLPRLLFLAGEIRKNGADIKSLLVGGDSQGATKLFRYLAEDIYDKQFVSLLETAIADEKEEVAVSDRAFQLFSDKITKLALWVTFGTFSAVLVLIYFLMRGFEVSLYTLMAGTRKIAGGVGDSRVELQSRDEFGELAAAFNQMADEIARKEKILRENNVKLRLEVVERRQAEHAEAKARRAAEEANRVKSEFLANMSHEIRTPMNGIIGFTDMLLKMAMGEKQRKFLQLVKISSDRLLTVINDILDFSKIEADKLSLEPVNFGLRQTVDETFHPLKLKAIEKKLVLDWQVDDEVPDELIGDHGRLSQVLINLVANAIKFTEEGEIEVKVEVVEKVSDFIFLHFSVRDTGIGIPEEKQGVIFDSFSQADTSHARKYGGTGLGLAISARLVAMMGGEIWVESDTTKFRRKDDARFLGGGGATFHFTARLGVMAGIDLAQDDYEAVPVAREISFSRNLKILLAEDDKINQIFAREILSQHGLHVTAVGNGMMAVEAMKNNDYDLVLMDIQMPEMDGYEATYAIRRMEREKNVPHTPIIALTAHAMKGDAEKCLAAGMDDYISKPIDSELLFVAIRKQVDAIDANRAKGGL